MKSRNTELPKAVTSISSIKRVASPVLLKSPASAKPIGLKKPGSALSTNAAPTS